LDRGKPRAGELTRPIHFSGTRRASLATFTKSTTVWLQSPSPTLVTGRYPKLRLADLTADQRAVLDHTVKVCVRKAQFSEIGGHCGLYDEVEQLARYG
jgi:hypothetical protein